MAEQTPKTSSTPEQPAATPAKRDPWTPPTLESLDVRQTLAMFGTGGDGSGIPGTTLS